MNIPRDFLLGLQYLMETDPVLGAFVVITLSVGIAMLGMMMMWRH